MIDLHCHLLPGVDDGAGDLDEAVRMARLAAADGTESLVLTPHQRHERWSNDDRGALETALSRLQAAVGERPQLLLGAEIAVDSELLSEVDRLPGGSLLPLAGSRYLLIELPAVKQGPEPRALVHELVLGGWHPILAHPERLHWLADDMEAIEGLVARGALIQVTAMSITGEFGRRAQVRARALLDRGLVHVVASDAHDPVRRPPGLSAAHRAVAERCGPDVASRLTYGNPAAVVRNRPLPAA